MGKVYESLKEVVKLQRSKNDPVALPGAKPNDASSLDVEIGELVQRITGLRAAVSHREEEIKKETQQVIQTLSEDFAILETKLRDAEETARRKESVSQKMEERLNAEIYTLQNELNREKQTLQIRDNDIKDLKSNIEVFAKQVTESERAIKQDANIRDMKEIIRSKEATINALEQELGTALRDFENQLRNKEELLAGRDAEINDLK